MARVFTFNAVMIDQLLRMTDEERPAHGLTIMDIVYVPGLWAGAAHAEQALYMEDLNSDGQNTRGGSVGMIYDTTSDLPTNLRGVNFTGVGSFSSASIVGGGPLRATSYRFTSAVLPATTMLTYDLSDSEAAHRAFFGGSDETGKRFHYPLFSSPRTTVHAYGRRRAVTATDMLNALGARAQTLGAMLVSSPRRSEKQSVLNDGSWNSPLPLRLVGTI